MWADVLFLILFYSSVLKDAGKSVYSVRRGTSSTTEKKRGEEASKTERSPVWRWFQSGQI